MTKHELAAVYEQAGPFATVYLDSTRATESAEHEVELRWRALRAQLADDGGADADLGALDVAIADDRQPGRSGLVLVARGGELAFRDHLPKPPLREIAAVAPLPYLMPYVAQRGPRTPYLVVTVDRTGADIATPAWAGGEVTEVTGQTQYPVHKTGRDDWSESHFQRRVENAWDSNARDAADAIVEQAARTRADLIVLAGEPHVRSLLETALVPGLRQDVRIVHIEHGGRADGASDDALAAAVDDAVLHHEWRRRRELLEHLQQNLGRKEYAAAGVADVVDALRRAAADTVVVSDDPSSTLHAYIGPEAVQLGLTEDELHDMGVSSPLRDRLDSALVRAAVGTGARLVTTPNAHEYLPEGIGALLRYDDRAEQ